jgi:hypothetical protein
VCVRKGDIVSGYKSKKLSAETRWIGPYPQTDRHADDITLDHIIDLRKRLAEAERQRDNALDIITTLHRKIRDGHY